MKNDTVDTILALVVLALLFIAAVVGHSYVSHTLY